MSFRRTIATVAALTAVILTSAPAVLAADALTVTTSYPAIVVAPGAHPSFDVSVKTTTPQRVALSLSGAPTGWTATLHGGGFVVDAVETNGTDAASVRVDVSLPSDATGTATLTLHASDATDAKDLALTIRVEATAGGNVTLTTDFPSLKGPASQTFNFNLTLNNQSDEDLTFSVNAQGPDGWDVAARLTGQSQAASAIVKAGSTSGVTVSATPPSGVAAGSYDIQVVATAGAKTYPGTLTVEVTGSYNLAIATSDQRLNANGSAGSSTDVALVVTNSGTAAVTNVKLTATTPTGWKVTFDNATIASIAAGGSANATAHMVPSSDAVAGDYSVTIRAAGDQSTSASVDIRFTVETSLIWAIVGIGLIVLVFAGLWWVFRKYGRR